MKTIWRGDRPTHLSGTGLSRARLGRTRLMLATSMAAASAITISPFSVEPVSALPPTATYSDTFSSQAYNNNDGTANFAGPWSESGDNNSAVGGTISINGGELEFDDIDGDSLSRLLDLSGANNVVLNFDWVAESDSGEQLAVELRDSGGSWDEITTLENDDGDHPALPYAVTIQMPTDYISNNSGIRFRSSSGDWGSSDEFRIDNLEFAVGTIATNPDLDAACGIDVTVVLDESGSIEDASAIGDVEDAVRALVQGLENTGSRIKFTEFSTNGRGASIGGSTAFQNVDASLVTDVESYLTNGGLAQVATSYNPGGGGDSEEWTNWEAGLAPALAGGPGELVVFITDGQPNTVGTSGGSLGGSFNDQRVIAAAAALDELDAIKATGSHVLAVGVGAASNQVNFDLLTQTVEAGTAQIWEGTGALDLRVTDALRVSNFDALDDALRQVVFALCAPSVSLTKVDDTGTPIEDWTFTGSVDVAHTSGLDQYEWVSPNLGVTADDGTGNDAGQAVQTNSSGVALYQWTPNTVNDPQPWDSTFTFSETLPSGWTIPAQQPDCNVERLNTNGTVSTFPVDLVANQTGSNVDFSLEDGGSAFDIAKADIVTCTVQNNRPATIIIIEDSLPNAAQDFSYSGDLGGFALDDDGNGTLPNQQSFSVTPGTYDVTQAPQPANWLLSDISCTPDGGSPGGTGAGDTASITVTPGSTVICTFTNVATANIVLEKEWVRGFPGDTAELTSDVGGNGVDRTFNSAATGVNPQIDTDTVSVPFVLGSTIDVAETVNPGANYDSSLACRDDVGGALLDQLQNVGADGRSATVLTDVAAAAVGGTITCTFTNPRREVTVEVVKNVVPVSDDGTFTMTIDGHALAPTTVTGGHGATTSTTANVADTITVSELAGDAGTDLANYTSTVSCTGPGVNASGSTSAQFDLPLAAADGTVTCTFTNTRKTSTLTLDKSWATGSPDDAEVTLTADGEFDGVAANSDTATSQSDGSPNDAAQITIFAGETVALSEAFVPGSDAALFDAALTCSGGGLSYAPGALSGSYAVPSSPTPVTCTFTNAPDEASFTLVKEWQNPRANDSVDLAASGDSGSGNSIGEPAAAPGPTTSAPMTVFSGETITFAESFSPAASALYSTTLTCRDGQGAVLVDGLSADADQRGGTFAFAGEPFDVTCTFVNARKSVDLTVAKSWVDAKVGDAVSITTTGATNNVDFDAVADTATETDTDATTYTVFADETLIFSEAFDVGDEAAYDTTLACVGTTDADPNDGLTVSAADTAGNGITCTYTNTRRSLQVRVAKQIEPSADPTRFALSIGGQVVLPAAGDNDTSAPTAVLVGDTIAVSENIDDNFTSALACNNGVAPANNVGTSGDVTVPSSLADGTVITCTFTNTRKSVELTLEKQWVVPEAGDTAVLDIDGLHDDDSATSTAPDAPTAANSATATVYAGETVDLAETLGVTNVASYDVSLDCVGNNGALSWVPNATTATLPIEVADTLGNGITCTFTNTAERGTIVIVKNTRSLSGPATFGFTGDWLDPIGFTIDTVGGIDASGSETFPGVLIGSYEVIETDSTPAYDGTEVTCVDVDGGSGPVVPSSALPLTGSIDLDDDETVVCTFTNVERSTIVVTKVADPQSAQDFGFTTTEPAAFDLLDDGFSLDDDADVTLSNTFTSVLLPAEKTYSVTELAAPGWTLDLQRSDCTAGGSFNGSTASITPAAGATVSCTFVNTANPAGLTATKDTLGVTGPWGPFEFTLAGGPFTGLGSQLVDSNVPTAQWADLVEGQTYTITENAVSGYLSGAVFSCLITLPGQSPAPLGDAGPDAGFQFVAVAGASYSCNITNVAIPPTLVIEKTTEGGFGTFDFDVTPTEGAPVPTVTVTTSAGDNPATSASQLLAAGVGYTVAEQANNDFVAQALTCTVEDADGATSPYVFDTPTQPGDAISCEITNLKKARIIVDKATIPGGAPTVFDFEQDWSGTIDGSPEFGLTDAATPEDSGLIAPNQTYNVVELFEPGWQLIDVVCSPSTNATTSVPGADAVITPAPGEVITCTFTSAQRGDVVVQKDIAPGGDVVQLADFQYRVEYDISVTTESFVDEAFVLSDEFTFGGGTTIDSWTATRTSPAGPQPEAAWNGGADAPPELVLAQGTISPNDAFTYHVIVDFTVAGTITAAERDCDTQTSGPGSGTLNVATVTFGDNGSNTDDACDEIPAPDISVDKTVAADQPVLVAGNTYSVTYTVSVDNTGAGPGAYTLTDTPAFGAGTTITNIAVSGDATIPAYVAGADIVSDLDIEAGGSDSYTVTVTFDVAGSMSSSDRDCVLETSESGTGTLNNADVAYNDGGTDHSDDCVEIPDPNISVSKTVAADQPVLVVGNTYTVEYAVTVSNSGDGPGSYTLTDTPAYGGGTTITNIAVSGDASIPSYVAGADIVSDLDIEAGGSDSYTVIVTFDVAGSMSSTDRDCVLETNEAGTGTLNNADVSYNDGGTDHSDDCVEIPDPNISVDKTVAADQPVLVAGNTYTVEYAVTVTNTGEGPGSYTLTDTPAFGAGATITNIAVSGDATIPAYTAGDPIVSDVDIEAGGSDSYTVLVTFDVAGTMAAIDRDCSSGVDRAGFGAFNSVEVTYNDQQSDQDDDCADIPDPNITVAKTVRPGQPEFVSGADFTVTYDVVVTNNGEGPGSYTLVEVPDFGTGITITDMTVTSSDAPVSGTFAYPGDLTVVAGEDLSSTESDSFEVIISLTVSGDATIDARTCSGAGSATFNEAVVSWNEQQVARADDCADLPDGDLQVTKTALAGQPVLVSGNEYTVTYDVTVSNNSDGPSSYTLTEAPAFGTGITVTAISASSSDAIVNPAFGLGDLIVVEDQELIVGASDSFAVVVTFTVDPSVTVDARTCDGADSATYNGASITFGADGSDDANDCVDVPGPNITVDKLVAADQPVLDAGNTYTVTYTVTVDNIGDGPGEYTLVDTPMFGDGTTITNIEVTGAELAADINEAAGPVTVVTDNAINADEAAHVYTVTVTFDVAGSMTSSDRDCVLETSESGTGTLNEASVTFNDNGSDQADDCAEIPDPNISVDKTVAADQPVLVAGNTYTVEYAVSVTNSGEGPGSYTLTDTPAYGAGTTITNIAVSGDATIPAYVAGTAIVADREIDSGASDAYTVTVTFDVAGSMTSSDRDCVLETSESGTGTLNNADVAYNDGGTDHSDDCVEIPDPNISVSKTVAADQPVLVVGNTYTVEYAVTVTNTGEGPGSYTLTDTPAYGGGTTITNIAVSGDASIPSYVAGADIVSDLDIEAGGSDSYTVIVTFDVAGSMSSSDRDCVLEANEAGTGTLNNADVAYNDGGTDHSDDCVEIPDPNISVSKTVAADQPVLVAGNTYTVEYAVTVTNTGEGPGSYTLTDTPAYGGGTTITNIAVSGDATIPAYVAGADIVSDLDIEAGGSDSYTVTVTFDVAGDMSSTERDCVLETNESGTGTLNNADVSYNDGGTDHSDDCVEIPEPNISVDKTVAADQPVLVADNTYTATYTVTVTNSGDGPGSYDLVDTTAFGAGATVTNITVTGDELLVAVSQDDAGPVTVILGNELDAGDSHEYTVVATFDVEGSMALVDRACSTGLDGAGFGAYNSVEVLWNEDQTSNDDACADIPDPEISVAKDVRIGQPVFVSGADFTVTYDAVVTNNGEGPGSYTLVEAPDFGTGVTITGMTVTSSDAPVSGTFAYPGDLTVVAAQDLLSGESDSFEVVISLTVSGDATTDARTCSGAGSATYNQVDVTYQGGVVSANDCADLPDGDLQVIKTALPDQPVLVSGNTYNVSYDVTVSNVSQGPGNYTLVEAPAFGTGTTVTDIAASSSDATVNPNFGLGDITVASDQELVVGATHSYTVVVTFTVDTDVTIDERTCAGEGTATYNSASITFGVDGSDQSDDCVEVPGPDITVDKVVADDQPVLVDGNTYDATYTVTVDNIGDGPGEYTLVDTPDFGVGATVTNIAVSGNGVSIDQPGAGPVTIITDEPITADEDAHVYTVTVRFDVAGSMTTEARTCIDGNDRAGSGAFNSVEVTYNDDGSDQADDCADIPEPNVDVDKSVEGGEAVRNADGTWTVSYLLDVTNLDATGEAGPAQYDLTDDFNFGAGVTVESTSTSIVSAPAGTVLVSPFLGVAPDNVVVEDVDINNGETHTYRVVANVSIAVGPGTDGDCTGEPGEATGLLNGMTATVFGEPVDDETCAGFATLTLVKEVSNDDGGNATVADFTLTAAGPAEISGTSPVASAVPAGAYDLSENDVAGYTTDGFDCVGGEQDGETVFVSDGDNVVCTIVNDDEPIDLELTKTDDGFEAIAGGDPIPYTITVQNIGTRDADLGEPVTVTDELPPFLSWNTFPANCSAAGSTLTCDIDPALMTAGGAAVTIDATVDAAPDAPSGDYENRAWVDTDDDPVCDGDGCVPPPCEAAAQNNNVDCEITPLERFASIFITKTDDVADGDFVRPGDTYSYELVVGNLGPSTVLSDLVVDDDLPGELTFVSTSGDARWVCNDSDPLECEWTGGATFPGDTLPPITVTVLVNDDALVEFIENTAIVTALVDDPPPLVEGLSRLSESHFGGVGDIVTAQDDETTPMQASADMAIIKTASVDQIGAGGGFDWILDITNNGPGVALGVTVGDLVPSDVVVTGVASSDFDCGRNGNAVTCTVASMAVGETGQVVIAVTVPPDAASGTVDNVGTVESETPDPDLTNNSDDASVIIVAQAVATTTLPPVTLPKTGSDATSSMAQMALLLVGLGGVVMLITRRRRGHGSALDAS